MKQMEDIQAFLTMLGLPYQGPPRHLTDELYQLRITLLKEEVREYIIAAERGNLSEQFDALIDIVYVALGTAYLHGFPFPHGWDEVHSANMRKVPGRSKRGLGFDARKPPDWAPPDLDTLLEEATNGTARRDPERATEEDGDDGQGSGYN